RVEVRHRLLDAMAELLAQPGASLDALNAFRVNRRPRDAFLLDSDPQLTRLGADLLQERPCGRRRPVGVTGRRPAAGVKKSGAIAHTACESMAAGQPAPAFAHIGTGWIARPTRAHAE